ncbi:MAG: glycosyl hydrolase family 65 protein, partial [Phycisphaerae bacterium]
WEKSRLGPDGLFWQIDDRDGMEVSIGGSGYRATINSYMYGDARAVARVARLAGRRELAAEYDAKAAKIGKLVHERLWDDEAKFFKVLPRTAKADAGPADKLADARELHGYVPWYFNLSDAGCEEAWKQLMDPNGFYAPFGPTTAERRHPRFRFAHRHDCQWNGPSWPFATTQTLVAMANLLNRYSQSFVGPKDYFTVLKNYARSHRRDGKPWIAENLDGVTGKWIVDKPRSLHYNHSGFCDLVITGLAGLRPREDDTVVVNPLVPQDGLDYFCLDSVPYHGRGLTILWDRTGRRYGKGPGLLVFADGKQVAAADALRRVTGRLPASR